MNKKQKTCLLIGIAVVVAMGLYPPWVIESQSQHYKFEFDPEPGPYSWIGSPPTVEIRKYRGKTLLSQEATARFIDLYRLGVQFFLVAVVTAGLVIVLKGKSPVKNKSLMAITRGFFTRGFFFTLISSVAVGFIIPLILCFYLVNECNWDDEGAFLLWFIFLLFSAGIWICYGIIRWKKNRNRSRNGRKKEGNSL